MKSKPPIQQIYIGKWNLNRFPRYLLNTTSPCFRPIWALRNTFGVYLCILTFELCFSELFSCEIQHGGRTDYQSYTEWNNKPFDISDVLLGITESLIQQLNNIALRKCVMMFRYCNFSVLFCKLFIQHSDKTFKTIIEDGVGKKVQVISIEF